MAGKGRAQGGNSGGVRPGSGRKRVETVEMQTSRRFAVLDVITDEEWRELLKSWLVLGRTVPQVIFPLLPYLLGGVKQEIDITFDVQEAAADLAAQYGVPPERVVSLVERLKAKRAG